MKPCRFFSKKILNGLFSEWIFTKRATSLDAFIREDEDFIPDDKNTEYYDALDFYKNLESKFSKLDAYISVNDLLDVKRMVNVIKSFIKESVLSRDKMFFNENITSRWIEFSLSGANGCLYNFSVFIMFIFGI